MKPQVYMTGNVVQTPTYTLGGLSRASMKVDSRKLQFPTSDLCSLDGRLNPEALFYSRRSSASSHRRQEQMQAYRFVNGKAVLGDGGGGDEMEEMGGPDLCRHLREEAACRVWRRGLSGHSSQQFDDTTSDTDVVSLSDWNMCKGFIFASPLDQISRTLRSNALYDLPGSVLRGNKAHGVPGGAVRLSPGCSQMEHLRRISHNLLPADADGEPFLIPEPETLRGVGSGSSLSHRQRHHNERLLRRLILSRRRADPTAMQNPFLSDDEEEEEGDGGGNGDEGEGKLSPMVFSGFTNTPQTCIYARRLVSAFLTGGMTWREVYRLLLPQSLTEQNIARFGAMTDSQKQVG
ncbi:unnamed protein product [Schistocephalus solidus]|uniref:Protein FAM212A n=1 Tax=Schistocephalus solidus TaxID=70667 RepID=A0A183TDF6_SCHSO|nr:unnamed protein product [Schistocephalus solidus]